MAQIVDLHCQYLMLRYIDDVFIMTYVQDQVQASSVVDSLFIYWPSRLERTTEPISTRVHFLDVDLNLENFNTSLYRKPTFNWIYVNKSSLHTQCSQRGWILNELNRFALICNNQKAFYAACTTTFIKAIRNLGFTFPIPVLKWSRKHWISRLESEPVIENQDEPSTWFR